jgi:hypothetical protein
MVMMLNRKQGNRSRQVELEMFFKRIGGQVQWLMPAIPATGETD